MNLQTELFHHQKLLRGTSSAVKQILTQQLQFDEEMIQVVAELPHAGRMMDCSHYLESTREQHELKSELFFVQNISSFPSLK